jgi:hypothetical protein
LENENCLYLAALELASEEARERYYRIGTQLFFLDDSGNITTTFP